jgi:hypothetical protein
VRLHLSKGKATKRSAEIHCKLFETKVKRDQPQMKDPQIVKQLKELVPVRIASALERQL